MQPKYEHIELKDAVCYLNQKVNMIGVIVEYGIPKWSRGTDCFCSLKIIDKSHRSPGIAVNIFSDKMDKLPNVKAAGDIILLSHVVVKQHEGDVNVTFNKKFSTYALYEGKHCQKLDPYQVSDKYHIKNGEREIIADMREWLNGVQLGTGSRECVVMSQIKEGEQFDLVCKILHTCKVTNDDWMAFVWDGTDAPPVKVKERVEDDKIPLPLQLEPVPLSRDILCTFPAVGTVLRVIGNAKTGIQWLISGKWMKFANIRCEVHAGLWHGALTPMNKMRYLSNEDPIILHHERSYNARISKKWERMPMSALPWPPHLTETDCKGVAFTTLMDIITYSEVTAKFRCVVRVLSMYPWLAEDFRSPSGVYRIRLTLEDPTARIHAFLYADDGEKFFEGFPSVDVLIKKQKILLGVNESSDGSIGDAPRNPPWMVCCLKSYYLDKSNLWGSRNYRIFGTKLLG